MIRIGVRSFVAGGGPSNDADAQAFIDAAGITDATQQGAINTLVTDLKGYGIWTKMKAIWPFVGGTSSSHKWNLKDPRDLDAAFRLVFSGGSTHSSTGWLPNGNNGYADTKLNASTKLNFNSAHLSYYSRSNTITADKGEIGVTQNTTTYLPLIALQIKRTQSGVSNRFSSYIYSYVASDAIIVENLDSKGFYLLTRTASNLFKAFKNNNQLGSTVTTNGQSFAPNRNFYIGAINYDGTSGTFTDRECAFASIGDGLTDTEAANLYTAVQAYQTTLNRQV